MDFIEKQKQLEAFKASLEGKTVEELKALEVEICKEADEVDNEIKTSTFKLETKGYENAAKAIRYFLNKQKVTWQYTVGLITMYDFWEPSKCPKKISYPVLDATLNTLGSLEFTGYEEWKMVTTVNDYFKTTTEEYRTLTEKVYDVADRHSAILDKIKIYEPIEGDVNITAE